jgi:two-component system, OmpR family, sensor histidine kinase KdpD
MSAPAMPMTFDTLRRFVRQLLLVGGLVAVTTLILVLVPGRLNTPIVALLYLLPVGLATTLGGLSLGILASLLAFLAFNYFFITPYYTLIVHQTEDLIVLGVFLGVAVVVSQLLGRARASVAAAEARERETTALYELSTALTGLRSEQAIAQALAERLREISGATLVELTFRAQPGAAPGTLRLPPDTPVPATPPLVALPLMTARGPFGEIRLWRAALPGQPAAPLSPAETRLLATFAGQGALALEHALLSQAETQAKILSESDRLKSALLSSVSHELRTPLASMKAAVTSLHSGEVEWNAPARADLLAMVEEELDHLNRLVGNLLDMSRIEAGALKPDRQWLSLAEVVGNTLQRLRLATAQHTLAVEVSDELPPVPADYGQMDQVLTNLLSNSLKYAPAGTVIRIRARTLPLPAPEAEPQTIQVTVQNDGPPLTSSTG